MITLLATLALLVEPAHWETAPDVKPADYPALARDLRINGTVTLECVNNEDGALSRCAAMSAKPADAGFQTISKQNFRKTFTKVRKFSVNPVKCDFVEGFQYCACFEWFYASSFKNFHLCHCCAYLFCQFTPS